MTTTTFSAPSTLSRSDEIEQFAYVASHDLSEPMRMVSGYLELLSQRYGSSLDQDAHDFIAYALDGARRMELYIDDLRTYSRVGRLEDAAEPVRCGALVHEVLAVLAAEIAAAGTRVEVGPLPDVVGERTQLREVFEMLISNAVKFRAEADPRVEISATSEPGFWRFTVRDNGIGLEPLHEERVFGLFQKLNGHRYPGTGMGLAISRKIVERHGGRMWIESAQGAGTSVHFQLPQTGK